MKQLYFLFLLMMMLPLATANGQTNITVTNPEVYDILKGNFAADDYLPATLINHPEDILEGLITEVSPDSLKEYLLRLSAFSNRNTGSDTVSTTFGIGAARRWAHTKFEEFSAQNEGRLQVAYLQFDQAICEMG
ncbi:MAG: hypothetical protein KDD02_18120, partial [Phaeodactylibacter sp.]|nr:hypothetical protein [Phaeodactylibacter sp.]